MTEQGKVIEENKYKDIIDYDWNEASLPERIPMAQRAKIFLPFAALTGYEQALEETLRMQITEIEDTKSD